MEGKISNQRGTVIGDTRHPNTQYGFDIVIGDTRYPVLVMQGRKPLSQLGQELTNVDKVKIRKVFHAEYDGGKLLYYLVISDDVEHQQRQ